MSRTRRLERRLLLVLVCAPLLGLVGVVAAEIVPDGRIAHRLVVARTAGVIERQERPTSSLGTVSDKFTECAAFSVGLGDQPGRNDVTSAIASPIYRGCRPLMRSLDVLEATGELPASQSYLRYWHGYAILTRPALGLFGVVGARWLAFTLLGVTVAGMTLAVWRRFGIVSAGLLLAPPLLTTDVLIGGTVAPHAIGMSAAWIGGWLALATIARHPRWTVAGLIAALAGSLSAYLDLMTTLPGAFALTVVGATLGYLGATGHVAVAWRVTAAAAVGWIAGLVWMWASKWLIAAIAFGTDEVVDNVRSQIEFRLSGEFEGVDPSRFRGLSENVGTWWDRPFTALTIAAVVGVVAAIVVRRRPDGPTVAHTAVCCLIPATVVGAWFVALNNHSQIHSWLTYRSLPIALGAMSALAYSAISSADRPVAALPSRS
jgi:hypothetical protein